jgi:hypothetical protein
MPGKNGIDVKGIQTKLIIVQNPNPTKMTKGAKSLLSGHNYTTDLNDNENPVLPYLFQNFVAPQKPLLLVIEGTSNKNQFLQCLKMLIFFAIFSK